MEETKSDTEKPEQDTKKENWLVQHKYGRAYRRSRKDYRTANQLLDYAYQNYLIEDRLGF